MHIYIYANVRWSSFLITLCYMFQGQLRVSVLQQLDSDIHEDCLPHQILTGLYGHIYL